MGVATSLSALSLIVACLAGGIALWALSESRETVNPSLPPSTEAAQAPGPAFSREHVEALAMDATFSNPPVDLAQGFRVNCDDIEYLSNGLWYVRCNYEIEVGTTAGTAVDTLLIDDSTGQVQRTRE